MKGNTNREGKQQQFMTKIKIRNGNRGYVWFNNGIVEVKAKECPEGFTRGRLIKRLKWFNDGVKEWQAESAPNAIPGRLKTLKGRQWYNDGNRNYLLAFPPKSMLDSGRMHFGMLPKITTIEKAQIVNKYKKETKKVKTHAKLNNV